MKKILLIPVAMVLVAVLVLGGCAEPAPAPSPEPAPTPAPTAPSRVVYVDVDNTARVILTYKASFLDSVVDRFAEVWGDMGK